MKRKVFLILLVAVLAISLGIVGCGAQGEEEEEEEEPEVIELTFSDHNPPTNPLAQAMVAYGQYIEACSDGKVAINVTVGGELYSDTELCPAVKSGACDAGTYVPWLGDGMYYVQVMALPFMGWPSQQDAMDIFWALCADFPEILGDFTSQNVTYATNYMLPPIQLHYYAENLTVDTPDDLNEYRIICLDGDLCDILDTIAEDMAIQMSVDVFDAVPAHEGDGFAMHLVFCHGLGLMGYFHSHTLFQGGISMVPVGVLWNTAKYNACKNIVGQDVMDAAAALWLSTVYGGVATDTVGAYEWMLSHNDTVVTLNSTQTAVWKTAVEEYIDAWVGNATNPALAQQIYDKAVYYIGGGA